MPIRSPSQSNDPKPPTVSPLPKPKLLLNLLGHGSHFNSNRNNRIRRGPISNLTPQHSPTKLPRQPTRTRILQPIRKHHKQIPSRTVHPSHSSTKSAEHRPKPTKIEPSPNNRKQQKYQRPYYEIHPRHKRTNFVQRRRKTQKNNLQFVINLLKNKIIKFL